MAEGRLTWEEFRKLPSEAERCRRYPELSAHDRFIARCAQDPGVRGAPCNDCVHKQEGCHACDAFPDNIPGEHVRKLYKDSTIECAEGIRYTKREDDEK